MPIFEFECASCRAEFEELIRPGAERAEAVCPSCGGREVRRKLSVFSAPASGAAKSLPVSPTCGTCGGAPGSCKSGMGRG